MGSSPLFSRSSSAVIHSLNLSGNGFLSRTRTIACDNERNRKMCFGDTTSGPLPDVWGTTLRYTGACCITCVADRDRERKRERERARGRDTLSHTHTTFTYSNTSARHACIKCVCGVNRLVGLSIRQRCHLTASFKSPLARARSADSRSARESLATL